MVSTRDEDSDYFRLKGSSRRRKMIGSQRVGHTETDTHFRQSGTATPNHRIAKQFILGGGYGIRFWKLLAEQIPR